LASSEALLRGKAVPFHRFGVVLGKARTPLVH
jgi:hypothetical protein